MGSMKVTSLNGVKVYSVSDHRSFPSWLPPSKLKSLKKNEDYSRRIELIQDMSFETAATRIKSTPDNEFIVVSGIYPPQVKVYEVRELSMKFERHLDAEIVDFQVLGDDYSKLAFLCADRSVWLHAKYGSHYQLRVPRMGRDIAYDCWSADLLVAASSPDLYRINLEQGRFLAPITTQSPAVNVLARSPLHGLLACGGEDGALECFDLRQKASVGRIVIDGVTRSENEEITSMRFDDNEGFLIAVGTRSGKVLLYDLRSSTPIYTKDHMYGMPIIDIKWHESLNSTGKHIISSDANVIRIWDSETGDAFTNIEPPVGSINDICVVRNSGLIFMALDSPQIPAYFIPTLGPAPRWCSYLENLTEEMEEEGHNVIYDDFKFVTKEDLDKLNLSNLIGTNLVHAYMHGFFIDHRLYNKAKSMVDPFAYETYRKQRIQEKLDAERANRITIKRKLPKVNKELAARLLADAGNSAESESEDNRNKKRKKKVKMPNLLEDDRFKAMFTDQAFEVDEEAEEYKLLHPNVKKNKTSLLAEHFNKVEDTDSDGTEADSVADLQSESDDSTVDKWSNKRGHRETKQKKKKDLDRASKPRFYEVKDDTHADAFRNNVSLNAERNLPLEERIKLAGLKDSNNHGNWKLQKKSQSGGREITFKVGAGKQQSTKGLNKKRSVKSLGFRNTKAKKWHIKK
ncbi:hypothetical protein KP509_16G023700 [Ceratopteris richardii]|uniref:Nucleolar protein 10 n=1 Tax=Ceratopteris richardii TaxID=49495 RepID=A0A8T2SZB6_CERRI|nr:hypothetical protein KP509_16G023700 [Ceratopteris richardii]KAH7387447.1 hypothetical protein KP509_16G023700 [Ceratopteris richardii]KAH7387448.1 hypothetical protein KP509_16G023700 [Ceratopteris richardii]KAH7387449.1 hypothetical protein KP509_16G023700 [Ceratopteris richardii]KAH7387452.1 hypothetical protein KP509_16G023700 [Ceratopteris richardii]